MEPPNNCKVYLFAAYVDMAHAQQAIDNLHNTDFIGNPIILSLAEFVQPLSKIGKRVKRSKNLRSLPHLPAISMVA